MKKCRILILTLVFEVALSTTTQGGGDHGVNKTPSSSQYDGVSANKYFVERINQLTEEADLRMEGKDPVDQSDDGEYPCIDISSWMRIRADNDEALTVSAKKELEEERAGVVKQVAEQAREAGSFNIRGHGIDKELFDRLELRTKEFFRLPLEEKLQYTNSGIAARGYKPIQSESSAPVYGRSRENNKKEASKDLRETFSVMYPLEGNPIQGPELYQQVLDEYIRHMDRLDQVLHELLTAALAYAKGITLPPNLLTSAKGSSTEGLLRASRYAAMPPEYKDAYRLRPHSDFGPLTILYSEAPGLEEIRDGKWIRVPVRKGELHVVIGETMAAVSNLSFQNNIHRVSHDATPDRTSYAYFSGQGFDLDNHAGGSNDGAAADSHTAKAGDNNDGIEAICAPGEPPMFGKISPSSHLKEYLTRYLLHGDIQWEQ